MAKDSFGAMPRSTLVIGGTRNLGPDLVAALIARGDRVTVLNRGVTPDDLPREVLRLRADRSDAAELGAALRGLSFDLVVDTALYTGPDAESVARVLDGRALRYVFWSTGQVYLVRTGLSAPYGEDDYDGPVMGEPLRSSTIDHDNWRYGVDKRAAEDALLAALRSRAFPYVSLRMPMINSPRDHYTRLAAYVHRLMDGGPILVPDDQGSLRLRHVFGGDVVAATLRAGEAHVPAGTCVNVSQDEALTLEEMLAPIGRLLRRPVTIVKRPRAELERQGLLPGCSPWSGRWMSQLANERSRGALALSYAPVAEYLPGLVDAAQRLPARQVIGYERRGEELAVS
jgi:nucleoside-diphosphate-sugar epimerase